MKACKLLLLILIINFSIVAAEEVTEIKENSNPKMLAQEEQALVQASTDHTTTLRNILKKLKSSHADLPLNRQIADLGQGETFTGEELIALCEQVIKKIKPFGSEVTDSQTYLQLEAFLQIMIRELSEYKISGVGFSMHPSYALLYGVSDFETSLLFKNQAGEMYNEKFNIQYQSVGWQNEIIFRFDVIFAVNSTLNIENTRQPQIFGAGFTGGWRLPVMAAEFYERNMHEMAIRDRLRYYPFTVAGLTILPFANMQGSLLIAHFGIGATGILPLKKMTDLHSINAAVVWSGGTLTRTEKN